MDTFEKIRALLAEQLDVDPAKITMDSDIMSDFEADSLDIVDMVMTLEDEFGIEVPDDAIGTRRLRSADADDAVGSDGKMPPGQFFGKGCDVLRHAAFAAVQIDIVVGAALHFGK